ncbi:hypothetical protein G7Z17_g4991 [Cylindrodendrum hubeiense]|uniref:Secreted protein n=1 Tax=Cylindrodendrum hubeiense TaxID=595255 RepID=A0A9P5HFU5_9HYPO|nr:hypothetical protein G7Z17_g4991 [Cylindrodendrum hubeiense]
MFKATLLVLVATHGLCNPVGQATKPIIKHFAWNEFAENTGINEKLYIRTPSKGVDETFECTPGPGPNRLSCPSAISAWDNLAEDSYLHVNESECISATKDLCRTVVCAPLGDLKIHIEEIVGRMWDPLSIRCVLGGTGGILQSDDSTFVLEMGKPKSV